jgi:hypothetical protein
MTYVPGYHYDFFVSYASVDNDPVASANCGWVTTLIGILTSGSGLSNLRAELEALGNVSMVKAIELDVKLQNLAKAATPPFPLRGRDDYGQAAF